MDNFPEGIQYMNEVVCCFDKSFNPVPCPRQSLECNFNDPVALPLYLNEVKIILVMEDKNLITMLSLWTGLK